MDDASTRPKGQTRAPLRATTAARLVVVYPPALARTIALDGPEVILGRSELAHETVSRRHLAITWDAARGEHVARDLDSHNGSALDGAALTAGTPLHDGSVLRLGDVLIIHERWRDRAGPLDADTVSRDAVPGDAMAMAMLRTRLARAAPDAAPALLLGETGTGKEHIAGELHARSGRRGAYLRINCAALSPQLVESQLFGHERGAFSGAGAAQPGVLREADGGTVLLDEIGDLPLDLQPKLLRVLQEGEILPVGGARPVRVDVRVIGATHQDLARAVEHGQFRRDLHARLALWQLRVPPLRERRVDLLAWLERLDRRFRERRGGRHALAVEPDAAETLLCAAWPDNLRGLDRLVHELATEDRTDPVTRDELPPWVTVRGEIVEDAAAPAARNPAPPRDEFVEAHRRLAGNVSALARHFGRDRKQIYRWLEAFGLKDEGGSRSS